MTKKDRPAWGAEYICLTCDHTWTGFAGPNDCPSCGALYVKWLNYEVMREGRWRDVGEPPAGF